MVRLYDIEGKDGSAELKTFFKIKSAEHTNLIEEEGRKIDSSTNALKVKIGHHAIETFRLFPVEE